jgi:hypothetical protein
MRWLSLGQITNNGAANFACSSSDNKHIIFAFELSDPVKELTCDKY